MDSKLKSGSTASTERSVPLKARQDLRSSAATFRGEPCWMVKDPIKLKYFRLSYQQYEVLQLLDGKRSLNQLKDCFVEHSSSPRPSLKQIQNIVFDLYTKGLAWSTRPGQGNSLDFRRDQELWGKFKRTATNLMFIRLPGFDPTWILATFYWVAKWLFHPAIVMWAASIVLFSWVFIGTHFSEIMLRVPTAESLISWQSTLMLWVVLGGTKIIHELGHAFACRHFRGECHEIGVAFLIFSPCLYCDVSDSWTLKSKWQRIAIAGAGIYVELLLAALAFFIWWRTHPGILHDVSFLVFVVSNISTLLFNLNPLLRLDGYYILSDWLEVPNLRQKSDKLLEHSILKNLAGISVPEDRTVPPERKRLLLFFAACSMLYRGLMVVVVCCVLFSMLKPYRLEYFGLLLGLATSVMGIVSWSKRLTEIGKANMDRHETDKKRLWLTGFAAIVALLVILLIPLPTYVKSPLRIEFADTQSLYVTTPGLLSSVHVKPGQMVQQGQILANLDNSEKSEQLVKLMVERRLQSIELRKQKGLVDAKEISLAHARLESIESEIKDQMAQLEKLQIKATQNGMVVAPLLRQRKHASKTSLPSWSDTPLELRNVGCYLEAGTRLLSIAPHRQFQAEMIVDQQDVHLLAQGQNVQVKLSHLPSMTLQGTIERISLATASPESSKENVNAPVPEQVSTQANDQDYYRAIVKIDDVTDHVLPGAHGVGRVSIKTNTVASRIWRTVCSTLHFKL